MNQQELAYIGTLDPYDKDEFQPTIIRVIDGITGVPIALKELYSLEDIRNFIVESIQAKHLYNNVLVIHVNAPESDKLGWLR